jgi:hypothetical protein
MIAIKNFIEKVSYSDGKRGKVDYIMSMNDARMLRDEMAKLLADYYAVVSAKQASDDVIKVEINGGKF